MKCLVVWSGLGAQLEIRRDAWRKFSDVVTRTTTSTQSTAYSFRLYCQYALPTLSYIAQVAELSPHLLIQQRIIEAILMKCLCFGVPEGFLHAHRLIGLPYLPTRRTYTLAVLFRTRLSPLAKQATE